ncbi:MAG: DUF1272 domain-containing protein [Pseudomonadales bacterium]|nr:DUF1272 domain-containing protein [Pseudomonadales bacterium]
MLELRPNCERCDVDLPVDSEVAHICSFECTFCQDCLEQLVKCPNCGGNFVPRPIRPQSLLSKFPPSTQRVRKDHE